MTDKHRPPFSTKDPRRETLFETLERLGYTTGPAANNLVGYRKAILKDGDVVFEGAAWDVWEWLRQRGEV